MSQPPIELTPFRRSVSRVPGKRAPRNDAIAAGRPAEFDARRPPASEVFRTCVTRISV